MAELLLPSLEIENFRAFKHLTIEKLGRVNLIVGENSVGKTCLLEAVWIFANKADFLTLREILSTRDERYIPSRLQSDDVENALSSLKYLFHNRKLNIGDSHIIVGTPSPPHKIELSLNYYTATDAGSGSSRPRTKLTATEAAELDNVDIRLAITEDDLPERSQSIAYLHKRPALFERDTSQPARHFLSTNGLHKSEIARLWDTAAIQSLDDEALSILKIIQPTLERLIMVEESRLMESSSRIPMAKMQNLDYFVPLRSLGDGMWRALGISLALVNSKNGILLIDEFENGLYHGVQTDLWRLIFRVAHELNIQVFATTHNWDCIEAFQKAAQEDQNEEAMLIRLQRQGEDIIAVTYDERELMIATREHIEVR